ncbi:putative sh3 domain-containing protein [Golovinomyces cichoracearum]|uniref:Putative sh3 domain-containing protein n=1 Tax=Golovinomyces cichoracearum TaxID=62708 RepID=A0A420J9S5_9PEZI|nr:putative sh3 domain-containing protein [Golovinomyces cichoracearum]
MAYVSPPNSTSPSSPSLSSPSHVRHSNSQRPASHVSKVRLSDRSSDLSPTRSNSYSHSVPELNTCLSFTIVRDFAYPDSHSMHYGSSIYSPQLSPAISTPGYENTVMISDQLDGPPWSEDEDLQSPVVISSRHRKQKSSDSSCNIGQCSKKEVRDTYSDYLGSSKYENDRRYFLSSSGDGHKTYYVSQGDESGPGGEIVIFPSDQARLYDPFNVPGQRDSHFAATLPKRSYADDFIHDFSGSETYSSNPSSPGPTTREESRYSRDYQFTITSSDEEMHGKAVALFDFVRENENELPLFEGQVIWVSYRHGQGWLVAEDPKTRESGLVPETYVRLLRDIHGEMNTNTKNMNDSFSSFQEPKAQSSSDYGHVSNSFSNSYDYQAPVVSTFSTSSKDLHPYPHYLLRTHEAQAPPRLIHYQSQNGGSQISTPTNLAPINHGLSMNTDGSSCLTPTVSTLPVTKLEIPELDKLSTNSPKNSSICTQKGDDTSLTSVKEI